MTITQACEQVLKESSCGMVRPTKKAMVPGPVQYDFHFYGAGKKKGWTYLDTTSASVYLQIYQRMTERQRQALEAMSLQKAIALIWRIAR